MEEQEDILDELRSSIAMMSSSGRYGNWLRKIKFCKECDDKFKKAYCKYVGLLMMVPMSVFLLVILMVRLLYIPSKQ